MDGQHLIKIQKTAFFVVCFCTALLMGCGKSLPPECEISDDQLGSFLPRLARSETATLIIDSRFTPFETLSIQAMASEWNSFGRSKIGRDFFKTVQVPIQPIEQPALTSDPETQCDFTSHEMNIPIVRIGPSERAQWDARGFKSNALGVTVRCSRSKKKVEKQAVFVNLFLGDPSLFKSAVAHELGHVLGLDHSCSESGDSKNYTSCDQIEGVQSHPYRIALLFPVFVGSFSSQVPTQPGIPQNVFGPKEQLRENDQRRICSLYYPD